MIIIKITPSDNSPEACAARRAEMVLEDQKRVARAMKVASNKDCDVECDICGELAFRGQGDLNCCIFVCTKCCT